MACPGAPANTVTKKSCIQARAPVPLLSEAFRTQRNLTKKASNRCSNTGFVRTRPEQQKGRPNARGPRAKTRPRFEAFRSQALPAGRRSNRPRVRTWASQSLGPQKDPNASPGSGSIDRPSGGFTRPRGVLATYYRGGYVALYLFSGQNYGVLWPNMWVIGLFDPDCHILWGFDQK